MVKKYYGLFNEEERARIIGQLFYVSWIYLLTTNSNKIHITTSRFVIFYKECFKSLVGCHSWSVIFHFRWFNSNNRPPCTHGFIWGHMALFTYTKFKYQNPGLCVHRIFWWPIDQYLPLVLLLNKYLMTIKSNHKPLAKCHNRKSLCSVNFQMWHRCMIHRFFLT